MPSACASPASSTALLIDRRSTPGIASIGVRLPEPSSTNEQALIRDLLAAGRELGLDYVYVHPIEEADVAPPAPTHMLTVYGADHPGIVAAVAGALAEREVNITDLQTRLAGDVYVMFLELALPAGTDIAGVVEAVGREQGVDVSLREIERDAL